MNCLTPTKKTGQGLALALLGALLLSTPLARAMSGTSQIAWKGQPVSNAPGWPEGAILLINDPLRTDGWNPFFSGHPNDVTFYEYKVQDTGDVNRLLKSLAAIKTTNVTLRLKPGKQATTLAFTTVLPEKNRTTVVFSLGKKQQWYEQLPEDKQGVRGSGGSRYKEAFVTMPTTPPTLTLYAGHEAIDLKQLKIPDAVTVVADVRADEKGLESTVKAIEEFMAGRKSKPVKSVEEHAAWVESCLKDFESIKPGMTRDEVEAGFNLDGGLQGVSPVRFVHPASSHFKVDVEFDFRSNAADQGRAISGTEDKVVRVSKPYIERQFMD